MRGENEIRECNDCGRVLPLKKFEAHGHGRRHTCIKCRAIRRRYKITGKQFFDMLNDQLHSCLICESPINENTAVIDHCHDSSNVRGLLCNGCNVGIAMLKHDKDFAYRAFEYLRFFK